MQGIIEFVYIQYKMKEYWFYSIINYIFAYKHTQIVS